MFTTKQYPIIITGAIPFLHVLQLYIATQCLLYVPVTAKQYPINTTGTGAIQ